MGNTGLLRRTRSVTKEVLGHQSLFESEFFSVYPYMFDPDQLMFLASCITKTAEIPGCNLEVGCARGATTAFLRRWMKCADIDKQYVAIDTFEGFPPEQADYEIVHRNKPARIKIAFRENNIAWVYRSLRLAGIHDVKLIKEDAAKFDYSTLKEIAFCLLDVDLYLPVAAALPNIYKNLSPGGIIAVDDCLEGDARWDGAFDAYMEFTKSLNLAPNIVGRKLGIIQKNYIDGRSSKVPFPPF